MEVKVYTIKLNPPRWLRNGIVYVALPIGALLGAAMAARAGVALTLFTKNMPIKAADVNANFKALGDAVTTLQGQAPSAWRKTTCPITQSGTQVATPPCVYSRIGNMIFVTVHSLLPNVPATGGVLIWSLPDGLKVDPLFVDLGRVGAGNDFDTSDHACTFVFSNMGGIIGSCGGTNGYLGTTTSLPLSGNTIAFSYTIGVLP